ncbi:CG4004 [Drosophila busckii]|uniref:CG4004 n=2 Tax=Drosophila busckii TaxID=30019 RepID=A0A0M3QZ88_DROBS|nr:uncharacterized protein LOC108605223 isoform X1 [Drosophila busckii]ALC48993.1 CG4004 [Drosophila busckii]
MTSTTLYEEKEIMIEFISCYRHFTALWDTNALDYLSKKKKQPGYQELLKILRRVNSGAGVQDVKRKINSLRCCYRREIKKIQNSYEGYEPRLWWFHMMDFLKPVLNLQNMQTSSPQASPPRQIKNDPLSVDDSLDEASMRDEDHFPDSYANEDDMLVIEGEQVPEAEHLGEAELVGEAEDDVELEPEELSAKTNMLPKQANVPNNAYAAASHRSSNYKLSSAHHHRRRRRRNSTDEDAYVAADSSLETLPPKRRRRYMELELLRRQQEELDHECDLVGKRMAAHFRNMSTNQRLFAERIIGEVLLYGRMEKLSINARFLPNGYAERDISANIIIEDD